jgi:hypothetical protein
LAKCKLDIDEPKLHIIGNAEDADFQNGLKSLRDKLANDHTLSNWFPHPMPGFPAYKDKVWKWDFKPTGERSSTRPGWRLLAYVPNPKGAEPILARPFLCWDKSKAPKGNQEKFLAEALKKFLSATVKIAPEEETFRHQVDGQGKTIALCQLCWDRVESADVEELELLKATHKQDCAGHPPSD